MAKKGTKLLVIAESTSLSTITVDWSKCCLCQSNNTDNLVCPARNKDRSKVISGYTSVADNLCAFKEIGELSSLKHFDQLNESSGIATTLRNREAKWHKSCVLQYNSTKLERAQKRCEASKQTAENHPESDRSTRSSSLQVDTTKPLCFICSLAEQRNNKLHLVTTLQLNDRVKQ